MDAVTETPMTVEEFDALPERCPYPRQYIRGKLVMTRLPPPEHLAVNSAIANALGRFLYCHPEFGGLYLHLNVAIQGPEGTERYQPDTLVYRRERLGLLQDCADWDSLVPVPDLAVEVLSPQTRHYDLDLKPMGYAQSGLPELWVADPERREVQVYLLQKDASRPAAAGGQLIAASPPLKPGETLRTGLLPGFELPVGRLFPPIDP
jgi:Uma2 family endonuclease